VSQGVLFGMPEEPTKPVNDPELEALLASVKFTNSERPAAHFYIVESSGPVEREIVARMLVLIRERGWRRKWWNRRYATVRLGPRWFYWVMAADAEYPPWPEHLHVRAGGPVVLNRAEWPPEE
jgi:hypothetical protein